MVKTRLPHQPGRSVTARNVFNKQTLEDTTKRSSEGQMPLCTLEFRRRHNRHDRFPRAGDRPLRCFIRFTAV